MPARPRILLVEDDPAIRAMELRILGAGGYDAVAAPNAGEALALAGSRPFDLFLLDVNLPDQDGLALARTLRAGARTARVPVVFVTALEKRALPEGEAPDTLLYLVK